ncbi:MAG: branched-chain amino acid ABC transporter permease [Candidatus Thermoplasmatota archaeon]
MNRDLIVVALVIAAVTAALSPLFGIAILQFLINGVVVGSIYVLGATGLSLIFSIRKFANFAHGEFMTFGAYMAFTVNAMWALDIVYGLVFAIVMTAVLAMILEFLVFRKLAGRGPVSLLVASIGVTIFLQNLVAATYGTDIKQYTLRAVRNISLYEEGGVQVLSIPPIRGLLPLGVSIALIVFLHLFLSRTTLGKAMRATADNPDLARSSGIKIRNVILWTWAIAGALAGVAGVLLAIVIDVRTNLGFGVLLFVFAAVIVGGLGSAYGAMVGGLVVGIAQELSAALLAWLGRPDVIGLEQPNAYRPIAAFLIMIIVLLIRPGGIAGGKQTGLATGRRRFRWAKLLARGGDP